MAADSSEKAGSLLHAVTRLIETNLQQTPHTYDDLITILSLACLLTILHRVSDNTVQALPHPATPPANPNLQKLLTDLLKGDGGHNTAEALMALLPLLSNPQVKSKLNPTTLASLLSLLNNVNLDKSSEKENKKEEKTAYKQEAKENKKADAPETAPAPAIENTPASDSVTTVTAAAAGTTQTASEGEQTPPVKRGMGKYLNWKNNF